MRRVWIFPPQIARIAQPKTEIVFQQGESGEGKNGPIGEQVTMDIRRHIEFPSIAESRRLWMSNRPNQNEQRELSTHARAAVPVSH
jgi:hypothetical protein